MNVLEFGFVVSTIVSFSLRTIRGTGSARVHAKTWVSTQTNVMKVF